MSDSLFWLKFWMMMAVAVSIMAVATAWYSNSLNQLRFAAWQNCLQVGGEPKDTAIIGSDQITFTCEKK